MHINLTIFSLHHLLHAMSQSSHNGSTENKNGFVRIINNWIISSSVTFTVQNLSFCSMQFCITSAAYHEGEAGISPIYPNKEITDLTSKTILLAERKELKVREWKWNTKCHSFLGTAMYLWKISIFLALTYETLPVNFIPVKLSLSFIFGIS